MRNEWIQNADGAWYDDRNGWWVDRTPYVNPDYFTLMKGSNVHGSAPSFGRFDTPEDAMAMADMLQRCMDEVNGAGDPDSTWDDPILDHADSMSKILLNILDELDRAEAKFPDQHLPGGTSSAMYAMAAEVAKYVCQRDHANGTVTWIDVLLEEVYEAAEEEDPVKLRAELVQVAAMAIRWIVDLGRVTL